MTTLIRETPFHKVWRSEGKNVFGNYSGDRYKYLVVDTYHGGVAALRTNSLIEALAFEVTRTPVEVMGDCLKVLIEEHNHMNNDFDHLRQYNMPRTIDIWNDVAKRNNRPELVITRKFTRRQELANHLAEIYESL